MSNPIVATIYVGYRIESEGHIYTVLGARKLRRRYLYIVEDEHGERYSYSRDRLLQEQRDGHTKVLGAIA